MADSMALDRIEAHAAAIARCLGGLLASSASRATLLGIMPLASEAADAE